MPPSSGELWGHHLMPTQVNVDFLLPTGILVSLQCQRDATLGSLKSALWKEARKHPLFYCLADPSSYIFGGITQDAQREEFYDETRRLCDLRLFMPILKIVEPMGNKEEAMQNATLGSALGMSVNDFNENKELEVLSFRRLTMLTCQKTVDERASRGPHGIALYIYPPDVFSKADLPPHIKQTIEKGEDKILIGVSIVGPNMESSKITLKMLHDAYPEHIIAESIRLRVRTFNMSPEERLQCVQQHQNTYILKVCGCEEFLLGEFPLSQYKYIRRCLSLSQKPELMLMSREALYKNLPKNTFTLPSYVKRGVQALQDIASQQTVSLWKLDAKLRIKVNVATYVNVRDRGEIYVKTGIYHGTEPLCLSRDTRSVTSSNPKWNEWLNYELYLRDIPRSSRLCLSLCSISKKQKRKVHYAIAWANINLFDFTNRLLSDKLSVKLWPMPPGLDNMLHPIGVPGILHLCLTERLIR